MGLIPAQYGADAPCLMPQPVCYAATVSDLNTCPACGSHQLFSGSIKSGEEYLFKPREVQIPALHFAEAEGIPFGPDAEFCARCGLLWVHADLTKARSFIEAYGSAEAIAILSESTAEGGPTAIMPPAPAPP